MGLSFGGIKSLVQSTAATVAQLVGQALTTGALTVAGHIVPTIDNTFNIGGIGKTWSDVFLNALRDTDNDIRLSIANNASSVLIGNMADAANAIAVKIANSNNYTTAGAKICAFYVGNGAVTEVAAITKDGTFNPAFTDDSANSGNRTVNKPSGANSIAIGAATCVITNSCVTATSIVVCSLQFADATATTILRVIPAAGSFTITVNAAATAATKFGWIVIGGA